MQGGISAVIGGMVAALTAWGVVSATRRHDRRFALEGEARDAAIKLFLMLIEIQPSLMQTVKEGTPQPRRTDTRDWALIVLTAEIAMFSLDRERGAEFSQAIGDYRRALEPIEGVPNPDRGQAERAMAAARKLIELLADWLMEGRHRDTVDPTGSGAAETPTS
ncbi:MAG TPA: hypothetical protein VGX25_11410 [Actinophytocola sp.]|uniref:hypothetical protein n=1 Tax=Actinophytocola sp. TaxID=1872138 RepID=UPI002DDD1183|nr:hypothetical protein [Actinophytocola sp.]HEV2779992.1 hypothetical protein [Actinophytocola sp.]